MVHVQWNLSNTDTLGPIICVLNREVSSFWGANNTFLYEAGTWSSVLIREVSLISGVSFKRGSTVAAICSSHVRSQEGWIEDGMFPLQRA